MPDAGASSPRTVELLAPAGDHDALVAAVRAGADAVYLGLSEFNARRGADNFSIGTLRDACDFAHLRGARVYLTANVLLLPDEAQAALTLVDDAWTAGVDAVIVQDLGLARLVRDQLPDVRLHASTQIGSHNPQTVAFLAEQGFDRVTLARELSLAEIAGVASGTGLEIETFVHGALCFCYSGQCILSSMIGGRSANRGLCAQPCRLPYALLDDDGEAIASEGAYLLSPKDLAGIARLPEYIAAGVSALKIEGRMKSAEYVALVTGVYREALDRALADPSSFEVTQGEWDVLEEAFNRGFTDAYLDGLSDERLMAKMRPNNRGVLIGRVASVAGPRATVRLERAVEPDDRLEFWTGRGRFTQTVSSMTIDDRDVTLGPAGADVMLEVEGPVSPGDRVFRVANASLIAAARRLINRAEEPRPVQVSFRVDIRVGEPLRVTAATAHHEATAYGAPVEPARTKPIGADEVVEHVGRLGGTPYEAAEWDVRLDAAAGLGYSALHQLRREALEQLDERRLATYRQRTSRHPSPPAVVATPRPTAARPVAHAAVSPALVAAVRSEEAAAACLAAGADSVLLDIAPAAPVRPLPPGVVPRLARIARASEAQVQLDWMRSGPSCAGNLGTLAAGASESGGVQADWPLSVTNPYAAAALADAGVGFVWLSPELTIEQVAQVAGGSPVPVGVSVLGRQELMVFEHCLLAGAGGCDQACGACDRRDRTRVLQDRREYRFPVWTDAAGRGHLANAIPLDATRSLAELARAGVSAVRLDLVLESAEEASRLTAAARERLDRAVAGEAAPTDRLLEPATGGHFFRGVS